jgi:hypothetical protein
MQENEKLIADGQQLIEKSLLPDDADEDWQQSLKPDQGLGRCPAM